MNKSGQVKRGQFPMTKAQAEKKKAKKSAVTQQIVQVVQGIAEKKFFDTTLNVASFPLAGTGLIQYLSNVVVGTTSVTRIGKRIGVKSIQLHGTVKTPSTSTFNGFIRYRVFVDTQVNGALPGITDIVVSDALPSLANAVNYQRFKTIWDKTIPMNGLSNGVGVITFENSQHWINEYITFKEPLEILYSTGNAGTIADCVSGAIYCVGWAYGFGTTAAESVLYSRIRFIDI